MTHPLTALMQVLMEVYTSLTKVDEFLPLSRRERYMFTFRGETLLVPSVDSECLPTADEPHLDQFIGGVSPPGLCRPVVLPAGHPAATPGELGRAGKAHAGAGGRHPQGLPGLVGAPCHFPGGTSLAPSLAHPSFPTPSTFSFPSACSRAYHQWVAWHGNSQSLFTSPTKRTLDHEFDDACAHLYRRSGDSVAVAFP